MTYKDKLALLREKMAKQGLDAFLILHTDPHQGEYLADYFQVMPWLTGFTGSAGTVLVTAEHAGVWTDSRYFIQAEDELQGAGFELMKLQIPHTPEYLGWIMENCPEGARIGVDASLLSLSRKDLFESRLKKCGQKLVDAGKLIDEIWKDRPEIPHNEVYVHDIAFAGRSRIQKLSHVRQLMKKDKATHYLIIALDEIAWTFNLRGKDVSYNPVFYSYAVVEENKCVLFTEESRLSSGEQKELSVDGVEIKPYEEVFAFLEKLPDNASLALDASKLSWKMQQTLPSSIKLIRKAKYAAILKGQKNETEIQLVKEVMVRDGVALVKFFRWIEESAKEGVSEHEAGLKLEVFRGQQKNYVGPSFHPIVGYKGNGAIVHYRAEAGKASTIRNEGVLLVDSGGQYLDGTTDITRTISLGNATENEKRDFTLVLKGHIQLAMAIFPEGTKGYQLESFARMPLWKAQANYGHGTGHGVGFFLNVHEGPQSLGTGATGGAAVPLAVGMLTSNEPGIYHKDQYGIRIENLVFCAEVGTSPTYGKFLGFDTVTLFPIDQKLIQKNLLNEEELNWLNAYHQLVMEKLSPHLEAAELSWLREACRAI